MHKYYYTDEQHVRQVVWKHFSKYFTLFYKFISIRLRINFHIYMPINIHINLRFIMHVNLHVFISIIIQPSIFHSKETKKAVNAAEAATTVREQFRKARISATAVPAAAVVRLPVE